MMYWFFFAVAVAIFIFISPLMYEVINSVAGDYTDPHTQIILYILPAAFLIIYTYFAIMRRRI